MANEKRLIDAKHLMESGWHLVRTGESNKFLASMSLADVPTVDAVPVVHGRWIHIVEDGKDGCYGFCSRCSTEHHADSASALKAFHRYCRWCGADMRERSEGE